MTQDGKLSEPQDDDSWEFGRLDFKSEDSKVAIPTLRAEAEEDAEEEEEPTSDQVFAQMLSARSSSGFPDLDKSETLEHMSKAFGMGLPSLRMISKYPILGSFTKLHTPIPEAFVPYVPHDISTRGYVHDGGRHERGM